MEFPYSIFWMLGYFLCPKETHILSGVLLKRDRVAGRCDRQEPESELRTLLS